MKMKHGLVVSVLLLLAATVHADGTNLLVNGGFETGTTAGWTVVISNGTSKGITQNGGSWMFARPPMPNGSVYAFFAQVYDNIATNFDLYQDFTNTRRGLCEFSFYHTMRHAGSPQTVTVYLDDTALTTYKSPSNAFFTRFVTNLICAAGAHQLRFHGSGTGDRTAIIDEVAFNRLYTENTFQVVGEPLAAGTVVPAYGYHDDYAEGTAFTCSAPARIEEHGTNCVCGGYTLVDFDVITGLATNTVAEGTGTSFDYVHGAAARRVIWHWSDPHYRVAVSNAVPDGGSVSTAGGEFAAGTAFTVTATPAAGYAFGRWIGDVDPSAATNATLSFAVTKAVTVHAVFYAADVGHCTFYVSNSGTDDNAHFGLLPSNPDATLAHALVHAVPGDHVLLADGTYAIDTAIYVTNGIHVIGNVAHPENVVVRRNGKYCSGTESRIFYLNGSVLTGVTVENGYSDHGALHGCGAYLAGATVSNCVIRSNFTIDGAQGAGVYMAGVSSLISCVLTNNYCALGDAGVGAAIAGNSAQCLVSNCVISCNYTAGGGTIYGPLVVRDSFIVDNISCVYASVNGDTAAITLNATTGCRSGGGGVVGGTCYNCVIANNSMRKQQYTSDLGGGGARGATLYNCLVVSNTSPYYGGGGTEGCRLFNCTVADNRGVAAGGVYGGVATNCVIWGNGLVGSSETTPTNNYDATAVLGYVCALPAPAEAHSIGVPPGFRGNRTKYGWEAYQLNTASPCINIGDDGAVTTDRDLAGHPRVIKRVDLGCYECNRPRGFYIIVR